MNNIYYIIRHGESVLNEQKRHQGWITGNPLTEKGKLQAEESADKLKTEKIDSIYASTLLRAKQTAKIIAGHLTLPITFSPLLKDYRRCKEHEGLNASEYSLLPDYLLWKENFERDKSFALPNGESLNDFEKRVTGFAKKLDSTIHNKHVVIVTHEAVVHYLIQYWLEKTLDTDLAKNARVFKVNPKTNTLEIL